MQYAKKIGGFCHFKRIAKQDVKILYAKRVKRMKKLGMAKNVWFVKHNTLLIE